MKEDFNRNLTSKELNNAISKIPKLNNKDFIDYNSHKDFKLIQFENEEILNIKKF